MSVEKYGKGWRYRFDLGPDPLTGKRRQATRGGFATKREATTAMNEAIRGHFALARASREGLAWCPGAPCGWLLSRGAET